MIGVESDHIRTPIDVWVVICQPGFPEYDIVFPKLRYIKEHLSLLAFDFHAKFDNVGDIASGGRPSVDHIQPATVS